jgi:hypothetical protein
MQLYGYLEAWLIQPVLMACRWLGVDRVFLTENAADPEMELVGSPALEKFIKDGFLHLETEAQPYAQIKVYDKCIREQRQNYNWIAFFDLDEFLVVRECVFVPVYGSTVLYTR